MSANLIATRNVQERPSGLWDYISPSRLNLWLRCPLAFRLRYVDGVRTPTSPAAFVGQVVHRSLECYYRHRQCGVMVGSEDLVAGLRRDWPQAVDAEAVAFSTGTDEQAALRQSVDLVNAYLAQVPITEPRPVAVEVSAEAPLVDPLTGEDLGMPLLGILDLVLPEADGLLITDFKTAARGGELLEVMHEVQLSAYAYLLRATTGQAESGLEIRSLVKTKTPRIETHRYPHRNAHHFGRLFAVIRAYLDDLDSGRFVFRPGLGCSCCDFRGSHCRSWQGHT